MNESAEADSLPWVTPWSRWFAFVLFVLLFILLVIWSTCWPLLVEVLSMMFYFIFVGWGHCWCFSWLLASCACVSWLCSSHFWFLDLNHVDFSMRVHSGPLPGYVSDRSVATVARYPTSFCKIWYVWFHLSVVGLGPLFLQVEACSPCSFLRSRVIRCECNEFVWNKSNEMIRKPRVKSWLRRKSSGAWFRR